MATSAAYIELDEGAAPGTPDAGKVRVYAKTDGHAYQKDDAGTETDLAAGGGSGVTDSINQLAADVSMPSATTWYDGPSLSLAAGTYNLFATVTIDNGGGGGAHHSARLTDGTNNYGSTEAHVGSGGAQCSLSLVGRVVLASTTTIKVQAASGAGITGSKILAANQINGAGNTASTLLAVKIA